MKKILPVTMIMALCSALCFFTIGCTPPKPQKTELNVGDGETLKVGIISDTQLNKDAPSDGVNKYQNNLILALNVLKARNVEMIIFAGDFVDLLSDYAYESFTKAFNQVFDDATKVPVKLFIMGNHDYWFEKDYNTTYKKQKLFVKHFGESPWTHKIVNGYHFVGLSPTSGAGYKKKNDSALKWGEKAIQEAIASDPTKPVFVVSHHNPSNTVYGSDAWGEPNLANMLSKYPQVISISGHSHYSILDERSIHQKEFTSVSTQSLSYIELEKGKFNGIKDISIPIESEKIHMLMVMNITKQKVEFQRISIEKTESDGTLGKEEQAGSRWSIPLPSGITKEGFIYTDVRSKDYTAPSFPITSTARLTDKVDINGCKILQFTAATDTHFVHSYKVIAKKLDGTIASEHLYFSDFYSGIDDMKTIFEIPLDINLSGEYNIEVYALNSYNITSKSGLTTRIKV